MVSCGPWICPELHFREIEIEISLALVKALLEVARQSKIIFGTAAGKHPMTDDVIWGDSGLVDSWKDALAEYKVRMLETGV